MRATRYVWPALAVRPAGQAVEVWHIDVADPDVALALFLEAIR